MALLEVNAIDVFYGHIQALNKVSVRIEEGETVALVGANGAGKTSLLKTISGILRPNAGGILYQRKEISTLSPAEIVRLGISQAPEGRRVFPQMTVLENLQMGCYLRKNAKEYFDKELNKIYGIFPILKERKNQISLTLSGGEQQMLTIGRALMANPTLLLLDEPSLGLAPTLVKTIFDIIQKIKAEKISILLVEQNSFMALSIADKGYVLENGKIAMTGTGRELLALPEIKESYLGKQITAKRRRKNTEQANH